MKNIYDNHNNIKIYATGSSSLNIKNRIQESLAGRKIINYLNPLSFSEFLEFKGKKSLINKIKNLKKLKVDGYMGLIPGLGELLEEFMIFGGYPEVVLAGKKEKKIEILESIFDMYVKKELVDYLKIEKIQNAKTLIEQIAVNNGAIANYSDYGKLSGLDLKTVKNYIEVLRETYLLNVIRPYFTNKNKELSKAPRLYFVDNGVRNYFLNNFNKLKLRDDSGMLFEGFYISELIKRGEKRDYIKYYRTKTRSEVDIIIDRVSELIPIELKYRTRISSRKELINIQTFMANYGVKKGYVVNIDQTGISENNIKRVDCFNDYF